MSKISFITPVAIDPLDLVLFGASAKPGLHFGTGLKYALAIFARIGIQFEMHIQKAGEPCAKGYILSSESIQHRGQLIERLHLGDIALPFTTNLGRNWKLWQGVRELVANTYEEGGWIYIETEAAEQNMEEYTAITIVGPELEDLIDQWDHFYLPSDRAVLATINNIEILEPAQGHAGALYCKGYIVSETPVSSSLRYSYNFLGECSLTEDRTAANAYALYLTAQAQLFGTEHDWIDEEIAFTDHYAESNYDGFKNNLAIWEDWLEDRYTKLQKTLREDFNNHRKQITSLFQEYPMQPWMQKQLDKISKRFDLSPFEIKPANCSFAYSGADEVYLDFAPDLYTTTLRLFTALISEGMIRPAQLLAEYLICPQERIGSAINPAGELRPDHAPAIAMDTGSLIESEADTVCSESPDDSEKMTHPAMNTSRQHPDFDNFDWEKADRDRDRNEGVAGLMLGDFD